MGRRKSTGERYPGGKLKPNKNKPDVEPISGALWQRIKQNAKQLALDPRCTTELGRLNWFGEFTVAQTAAGFRIAEIYGRFERYKKLKRGAKSPSYDATFGEAGAAEELMGDAALEQLQARIRDAHEKFVALQDNITRTAPRLRPYIEALCVEDHAINPVLYDPMRTFLGLMAVKFAIHSAPPATALSGRHALRGPSLHFNKHEDPDTPAAAGASPAPKPVNLDRAAFFEVAKKIAPHLDTKQIEVAYDTQQALKARAVFRRAKERKAGTNVIPFGGR